MPEKPFPIAIAQMPITGDPVKNGSVVRALMKDATDLGARLIQFPEGALSGYAKNPIKNWEEVNWFNVRTELELILQAAKQHKLWVVLGSAHPLTSPSWPHNSLYVISDEGSVVTRYDKRICSHTETSRFYTPGTEAVTFNIDGVVFGCLICIEINFPSLFHEYQNLGIDCLLLSSYPEDSIFHTKACALAAIHNYWVGLSIPTERKHLMQSGLIGPDGIPIEEVRSEHGVVVGLLDRSEPKFEGILGFSRMWRKKAHEEFSSRNSSTDPRSVSRTII